MMLICENAASRMASRSSRGRNHSRSSRNRSHNLLHHEAAANAR